MQPRSTESGTTALIVRVNHWVLSSGLGSIHHAVVRNHFSHRTTSYFVYHGLSSIWFHKLRKCSPDHNSPHFCVENPQCCVSGHIHLTLEDFASGSYCSDRVLDVGYCSMVYVSSTLHIYMVSHL